MELLLIEVERLEGADLGCSGGRDQFYFEYVKFEILLDYPSGGIQLDFQLEMLI